MSLWNTFFIIARLTINVLDINDNAPRFRPFGVSNFTEKILEGAQPGTTLLSVSAVDPDKGPNGQVIYQLLHLPRGGYVRLEDPSTGMTTGRSTVLHHLFASLLHPSHCAPSTLIGYIFSSTREWHVSFQPNILIIQTDINGEKKSNYMWFTSTKQYCSFRCKPNRNEYFHRETMLDISIWTQYLPKEKNINNPNQTISSKKFEFQLESKWSRILWIRSQVYILSLRLSSKKWNIFHFFQVLISKLLN